VGGIWSRNNARQRRTGNHAGRGGQKEENGVKVCEGWEWLYRSNPTTTQKNKKTQPTQPKPQQTAIIVPVNKGTRKDSAALQVKPIQKESC